MAEVERMTEDKVIVRLDGRTKKIYPLEQAQFDAFRHRGGQVVSLHTAEQEIRQAQRGETHTVWAELDDTGLAYLVVLSKPASGKVRHTVHAAALWLDWAGGPGT